MKHKFPKIIYFLLCFLLIFEQSGFAQSAGELNISAHLAALHNALTVDRFRPLHLRYLSYDTPNNNFKLLLDKGDLKNLRTNELENTSKELLNYFFIGISLPNDSFWVNLRPDSPNNIIDPYLAQTDLGKILLEADLQLKKDTANFTSPQTPEGKEYWDKLYRKAGELFGSENVTIPTLTRPWIVPNEIIIRETVDSRSWIVDSGKSEPSAYIYKATLKVMLEEDYLKNSQPQSTIHNPSSTIYAFKDSRSKELNEYSTQLIRELIIPKLTKDINTAKRYAPLRQVYYSLILAQWFKQKFYGKGGLYSHLINKNNLTGLTSKEAWAKNTYFQAYQKSFKEGEYNIKEQVYSFGSPTIRSYMSGGIVIGGDAITEAIKTGGQIAGSPLRPVAAINPKGLLGEFRPDGKIQEPYSGAISIQKGITQVGSLLTEQPAVPPTVQENAQPAGSPAGEKIASSAVSKNDQRDLVSEWQGEHGSLLKAIKEAADMVEKVNQAIRDLKSSNDIDKLLKGALLIIAYLDEKTFSQRYLEWNGESQAMYTRLTKINEGMSRKYEDLQLDRKGLETKKNKWKFSLKLFRKQNEVMEKNILVIEGQLSQLKESLELYREIIGDDPYGLRFSQMAESARGSIYRFIVNDILEIIKNKYSELLASCQEMSIPGLTNNFLALEKQLKEYKDILDFLLQKSPYSEVRGALRLSEKEQYEAGIFNTISEGRISLIDFITSKLDSTTASKVPPENIQYLKSLIVEEIFHYLYRFQREKSEKLGFALLRLAKLNSSLRVELTSLVIMNAYRDSGVSGFSPFYYQIGEFFSSLTQSEVEQLRQKNISGLTEVLDIARANASNFTKSYITNPLFLKFEESFLKNGYLGINSEDKEHLLKVYFEGNQYYKHLFGEYLIIYREDENKAKETRIVTDHDIINLKDAIERTCQELGIEPDFIKDWRNEELSNPAFEGVFQGLEKMFLELLKSGDKNKEFFAMDFFDKWSNVWVKKALDFKDTYPAMKDILRSSANEDLKNRILEILKHQILYVGEDESITRKILKVFNPKIVPYTEIIYNTFSILGKWDFILAPLIRGELNKGLVENKGDLVRTIFSQPELKELKDRFISYLSQNYKILEAVIERFTGSLNIFDHRAKIITDILSASYNQPLLISAFLDPSNTALNSIFLKADGNMDTFIVEILNPANDLKSELKLNILTTLLDYTKFNQKQFDVLIDAFLKAKQEQETSFLIAGIIAQWFSNPTATLSLPAALRGSLEKTSNGLMDINNPLHLLANYISIKIKLNQSTARREITYKDFNFIIEKARNREKIDIADNGDLSQDVKLNIRGLAYEAFLMRNKMLEMEQRAKELGRKFIVIANMSYGGVAIAPITEERNGDTYIVSTKIPVWYAKVGSTESHNDEFVLVKGLFTPEQLKFLIRENPLMTVVDGSTSVSNSSRTSAHIPDGFKGYRNFLMILNQALYGRVNPADFYEDEDFVKGLMDTPSAKDLMQQIQGVAVKPRAPSAYKFRFWYERKQDDTKEQFLYLRVGKKKDTIAPKTEDVNTLDSPTCLFIQSAVHPQDVPVDIKNNFIGETHTPAYFDDKEHFKEFYLDYEEGYGVVLSKRYTYLARNIFREFMKSQGRDLQAQAATQGKSRSIDTVVLDLDGTLTATDAILDNGTVRVINSLLKEGMRVVIITEDIEENLEDRLSKIAKTSNLFIFSDGGTKGYSFNETGHKVYFNDYNVKSAIQEDLRSRVRDIISSNFASERWQEDNRDSSMVNEIKRTSDYRIDLRFVKERGNFVNRLKTLLSQAGVKTKVYKIGKAEVKISLQDKADALRYLLERDSAIDSSKVLIVGDSARSDRNDRALLTSFPEAVSVNVGSFSPTISNENHSIVQYDRGGINATLMLLSNLELFKRLAENLIVPSSKGQSDESEDAGVSLQAAASPVIYFDAGQNKAMAFLEVNPRAWVIFADMLKLSLINDYYGMNIADIFIADAIRIARNVLSEHGGIGFRLGERSDEVAMVLPGLLQPQETREILQNIQREIKNEYQNYYIARLRDGLIETVKGAFGVREAERTARENQGGDTEYITTVLFVKDGADTNGRLTLDRILKESGLDSGLGEIEEALPPYLSAGAARLQEEGSLENKFDSSLHKAEIFQGVAKQANQLVGVEGLNKIPDTKVGVKLDGSAFSKLKEYMAKFEISSRALREFVKARYGDNEAMQIQLDDGYAAFMRRNLYEILEYAIEKAKSADSFIFVVRGPPDNFYIITAAQGKWQITAVRQNILTVEGSSLENNFLTIIEESGRGLRAKGKYPFKVINDFEELGHYFGNQLIKLDNISLLDAFDIPLAKAKEKNGILGEQSINAALSDASNKINSLLSERGLAFSVNFEAVSVTSDDFTGQENQTSAGKAKAVLEIIKKLNAARKIVNIPDNSVKLYSEYKSRWLEIEKEIGLIAAKKATNAKAGLAEVHRNINMPEESAAASPTNNNLIKLRDKIEGLGGKIEIVKLSSLKGDSPDYHNKIIELDLNDFFKKSQELERYQELRDEILFFANALLSNVGVADRGNMVFAIKESIQNAFVHGNKANPSYPIFIWLNINEDNQLLSTEIYNALLDEFDAKALEKARQAKLFGAGQGEKSIKEVVEFKREELKDEAGSIIGTKVILVPFDIQKERVRGASSMEKQSASSAVSEDKSAVSPVTEVSVDKSPLVIYGKTYDLPQDTVNNIRLSKIGKEDIEAIIELSKLVDDKQNEGVTRTIYREAVSAQAEREERYRLSGKLELIGGGQFILVYRNERNDAIGFIYAILEKDGKSARIAEIAVDRKHQGRDIGEALLAVMMEKMESMGVTRFRALPVNVRSEELFDFFEYKKEKKDNKYDKYYSFTSGAVSSPVENEKTASSAVEKAKEYTEQFIGRFGAPDAVFGGVKELNNPKARAETIGKEIYINSLWIDKMAEDEMERVTAHEVQHTRTDFLRDEKGLKIGGLHKVEAFQDLQQRIGELYDKTIQEKGNVFAKPKNQYQENWEVLSLLRGYAIYREQIDKGVQVTTQPYEFIEVFRPEDLNFLSEDYLFKVTKDFEPVVGQGIKITYEDLDHPNPEPATSLAPKEKSSSPATSDKGGIDFRALPIVNPPMNTAMFKLSAADLNRLNSFNLNSEWGQIQNMVNAGIIPSSDRIKEYLQACCQKQDLNQDIDKVLACIADILRLEEERVAGTDVSLKEMLALLESDKPADEMQFALAKITVEAKEPKALKQ